MYALLQITDSLFPSGAFAHSYGLEGLLQRYDRLDAAAWRALLGEIWTMHLLRADGLLGLHAHRALVAGDVDGVCEADRRLYSMKLPRELRDASISTGRAFLAEACCIIPDPRLGELHGRVDGGTTPGNHAIAFHATAAAIGVDERESVVAWGYQTVAQMTAALMRLGALGHRAATSIIASLRDTVEDGVRSLLDDSAAEVTSFAPLLEIASMRHERQYSRLFRS